MAKYWIYIKKAEAIIAAMQDQALRTNYFPQVFEILGCCPVGPVLPHREKVPL